MIKMVRTPAYNYNFNTRSGYFERWGTSFEDDPQFSPIGPELADIEISTICNNNCPHCYKSNTSIGQNMSLETFEKVLDKLPKSILQIAFGIGNLDANPDTFKIFELCRERGIVPNVTISSNDRITFSEFASLAVTCGAIAISNYDKKRCYTAVCLLSQYFNHSQINIHQLLSEETFEQCLEVAKDSKTDPRLSKLNAIVFLSLKQKGRGESYHRVTDEHFKELIRFCLDNNVRFGFDSCTANKFIKCIKELDLDQKTIDKLCVNVESCESGLFSIYINVEGVAFPCSFTETKYSGINLLEQNDFLQDVWYGDYPFKYFRDILLKNCRECPVYEI